ncbi:MAG: hypothetical protein JW384_03858 [Nitrosomonadaceae bacterium]|nr:hypothetical protein [Nitrosomonadaceae bacterium]
MAQAWWKRGFKLTEKSIDEIKKELGTPAAVLPHASYINHINATPIPKPSTPYVAPVPQPPCHDRGNNLVFNVGNVAFYGGGWSKDAEPSGVDVTIDLADVASIQYNKWVAPKAFKNFNKAFRVIEIVKLNIKDGGVPPHGDMPWQNLWKDILAEAVRLKHTVEDPYKVLVMCHGGHGRTGLGLVAFMHVSGFEWEGDPIQSLRANYCHKVVETVVQIDWLEKTFDFKTESKGSYMMASAIPSQHTYQGGYHNVKGGGYNVGGYGDSYGD